MVTSEKTTKAVCLLFICALFVAFSAACSNKPAAEGENISAGGNTDESRSPGDVTEAETAAYETEAEIDPVLPDINFGGYNFRILVRYYPSENHTAYQARDIYSDEESGEPINDAVYKRNRYVEDKYNCVISQILAEDHQAKLSRSVKAGSDDYDLHYATLGDFSGNITRGDYMDLNSFPYIDLDAPWWETNAKNSLSVGGKLYFCPSDLILLHNDSSSALVFNKKLIGDYHMESPYSLVLSGKWTVDKLIEMTKDI